MWLSKICEILGVKLNRDDKKIKTIAPLSIAQHNHLSFIDSDKYLKELKDTKAGVIILKEEYLKEAPKEAFLIVSKHPYLDIAYLSKYFVKPPLTNRGKEPKISKSVKIMSSVFIGKDSVIESNVTIMNGAYIGERCHIGKNSIIYPNVVIYSDTKIGNNCIIHAGSVIGSDGFGYVQTEDNRHVKIYHLGSVIIEDNVEIGANTTIDRAVFGITHIKRGTKIDNLVHIAHNCIIGENSIIAAQCGLSGSTKVGKNVIFAGQCGTAGHQYIGDFAIFGAKSGIHGNVEPKKVYIGYPHLEQKEWLRLQKRLLELVRKSK